MAVLLVAAGFAIRSGVDDQLVDATDNQLELQAAAVGRLLVATAGPEPGLTDGLDDPGESFTQILDASGRVVLASRGLPSGPLLDAGQRDDANEGMTIRLRGVRVEPDEGDDEIDTSALEETDDEAFEDDRARVLARHVEVRGREYEVIVGITLEDREDALRALGHVLVIALPVALALACFVGWLAIGAALRPVDLMRRQADRISGGTGGDRLELPDADDELRRLAETLNAMLGRLGDALDRERGFTADASHELRTPLAMMQTELELALRGERTPDELRAAIESALEETRQLSGLTDALLLLARADHDRLELATEPVMLDELVRRAANRAQVAAGGTAEVVFEMDEGLTVTADAARLEQAVGNLVDNALRHGAGPVEIVAERDGGMIALTVRDHGPGIAPEFAARAFERFARADASRATPGTGLGLAIVRAVAEAHGGSAALAPAPGGGTVATLRLPA
ncbi:MAG: HAMP domain-containing protein [Solirubrobacteraceae bacterium]|nr:HAMP domain-containing protein [Solirubrobacteraceae bacterium]